MIYGIEKFNLRRVYGLAQAAFALLPHASGNLMPGVRPIVCLSGDDNLVLIYEVRGRRHLFSRHQHKANLFRMHCLLIKHPVSWAIHKGFADALNSLARLLRHCLTTWPPTLLGHCHALGGGVASGAFGYHKAGAYRVYTYRSSIAVTVCRHTTTCCAIRLGHNNRTTASPGFQLGASGSRRT